MNLRRKTSSLILFLSVSIYSFAQKRFPKPEFETGHVPPEPQLPLPRDLFFQYLDVIVLFAMLVLMSWFVIRKRSRRGIIWTGVASIAYFGFYKEGCICSIGSIQNISLALFDSAYVVPLSVILIFTLPLIFTLFFGRTFCAGVCFMGALQDLIAIKPIKIPSWIEKSLRIIPYTYLFLAILFAATGSDFIICKYDPFIGFFRMNASAGMIIFGVIILVTGVFVARPYCRFLCPYGVILSWLSGISQWHTTITPTECVSCKLCENSCPVEAIDMPSKAEPETNQKGVKRLILMVILIPALMFGGGFTASYFSEPLSLVNKTVRLADEMAFEKISDEISQSEEAKAFRTMGVEFADLQTSAAEIQQKFYTGTWILGVILGLILAITLVNLSVLQTREDYVPNKMNCVSCGKCYDFCPVGKQN